MFKRLAVSSATHFIAAPSRRYVSNVRWMRRSSAPTATIVAQTHHQREPEAVQQQQQQQHGSTSDKLILDPRGRIDEDWLIRTFPVVAKTKASDILNKLRTACGVDKVRVAHLIVLGLSENEKRRMEKAGIPEIVTDSVKQFTQRN